MKEIQENLDLSQDGSTLEVGLAARTVLDCMIRKLWSRHSRA